MKLTQLEKNVDVVIEGLSSGNLYFLRLVNFPSKNNKRTIKRFNTIPAVTVPLEKIENLIEDERYILVKVEED